MSPHTPGTPTPERSSSARLAPLDEPRAAGARRDASGGRGHQIRKATGVLLALVALVPVTGCGASPTEQEYRKWADRWAVTDDDPNRSEDSIRAAANSPCRNPRFDLPPNEKNMQTVIKGLAAVMMAVCPGKAGDMLQARIDQGPSSSQVRDELQRMLTDVRG